ncbi:MAG: uridine kinase [Pseudomonadota bacterium]
MTNVYLIGIAGGSCSGKTRLLRHVLTELGEDRCSVVLQDNYYFSQPDAQEDNLQFNFDHPNSIDFDLLASDLSRVRAGESIRSPHYDFSRHERIEGMGHDVLPRPIVLVDGILLLTSPAVREILDLKVYIRCDASERLTRRIRRDVAERGRTRDNVIAQFQQQVEPMHQQFVSPSATYADVCFAESEVNDGSARKWLSGHAMSQISVQDSE